MTGNNVVAFPAPTCVCGQPGRRITIALQDVDQFTTVMCDGCVERKEVLLDNVKPVFTTMLECGVDREVANDVMIYLVELIEP